MHEAIFLSILFVGAVLSIVETGLIIFIIQAYRVPMKQLQVLLFLTICWALFLALEIVANHFGNHNFVLAANITGTLPLVICLIWLPKLMKFYHKALLFGGGIVATVTIALVWLTYAGIYNGDTIYHVLAIFPLFFSYFLIMEAALRNK